MAQHLESQMLNNSTAVEETKEEYMADDDEEIEEDESFDFSMKREVFEQSNLAQTGLA